MKLFYKTTLIVVTSLLVIVGGIFLGIINPLMSKFSNTYQKNLDFNKQISALQEKHSYLSNIKENQDEISSANKKFSEFLPTKNQVEDVLVQLDALARASTNNLPTFSVQEGEKNKTTGEFKTTKISMAIIGNYETIRSFINSLENLQRFTVIETLCIGASENEASAKITITVYHHE